MQIHSKELMLAVCLGTAAAVGGLAGCNTQGRNAGTYIDDRAVSSRVKGALDDEPVYKFPNVEVTSFNGTVQLNGYVVNPEQKQQAARVASHVEGVHQLVNNIAIHPQTMSPTGRTEGTVYPTPPPQPQPQTQPQPQ